jgi:hypothetical protein
MISSHRWRVCSSSPMPRVCRSLGQGRHRLGSGAGGYRQRGCSSGVGPGPAELCRPHSGARVSMTSSDLDVTRVDSAGATGRDEGMTKHMRVRALVIWMPTVAARRRRRRVAACRSSRVPRLLKRTGLQVRRPVAWSMARPTADGSGTRTLLVPSPRTPQDTVTMFFTDVGDIRACGFEDPQAQQTEHSDPARSRTDRVAGERRQAGPRTVGG